LVVTEPINTFELANSLFRTGNISAARSSYESRLTQSPSPEEELWLRCLVGCCYRLEGNLAKSEETYRTLANSKLYSYFPVDHSKWCLKYVEKRREMKTRFQEIESEVSGVLMEVKKRNE